MKKNGIISVLSSIVIEGIRKPLFFLQIKKKTQIQLLTNLKKNLTY